MNLTISGELSKEAHPVVIGSQLELWSEGQWFESLCRQILSGCTSGSKEVKDIFGSLDQCQGRLGMLKNLHSFWNLCPTAGQIWIIDYIPNYIFAEKYLSLNMTLNNNCGRSICHPWREDDPFLFQGQKVTIGNNLTLWTLSVFWTRGRDPSGPLSLTWEVEFCQNNRHFLTECSHLSTVRPIYRQICLKIANIECMLKFSFKSVPLLQRSRNSLS